MGSDLSWRFADTLVNLAMDLISPELPSQESAQQINGAVSYIDQLRSLSHDLNWGDLSEALDTAKERLEAHSLLRQTNRHPPVCNDVVASETYHAPAEDGLEVQDTHMVAPLEPSTSTVRPQVLRTTTAANSLAMRTVGDNAVTARPPPSEDHEVSWARIVTGSEGTIRRRTGNTYEGPDFRHSRPALYAVARHHGPEVAFGGVGAGKAAREDTSQTRQQLRPAPPGFIRKVAVYNKYEHVPPSTRRTSSRAWGNANRLDDEWKVV